MTHSSTDAATSQGRTLAAGTHQSDAVLPRSSEWILPPLGIRLPRWWIFASLALMGVIACLMVGALTLGDMTYPLNVVAKVLIGGGDATQRLVIIDWRLSRTLVAALVGACLGLAGAITQTVARNPLASPDMLGIAMGASAAAVIAIVLGGNHFTVAGFSLSVPGAALVGGGLTAAVMLLLAGGHHVDIYRLILTGIGMNAFLGAVVSYTLLVGELDRVEMATMWLTGAITTQSFPHAIVLATALLGATVVLFIVAFHLPVLSLGLAHARSLAATTAAVVTMLTVAVVLTALSTAVAGPIPFVAFVAGHLARVLLKASAPPLLSSAVLGAGLVVVSDIITRQLLPVTLPTGIATALIGMPIFVLLLIQQQRRRTSGNNLPRRVTP